METVKDMSLREMFEEAVREGAKYVFTEMYIQGYPSSELIINPIDNMEKKLAYLESQYDENGYHRNGAPVELHGYGYLHDMSDIEYVYKIDDGEQLEMDFDGKE